jgi:hypothetical protein
MEKKKTARKFENIIYDPKQLNSEESYLVIRETPNQNQSNEQQIFLCKEGFVSTLLVPTPQYNQESSVGTGRIKTEYELHQHDSNNGLDFLPLEKTDFVNPLVLFILHEKDVPANKRLLVPPQLTELFLLQNPPSFNRMRKRFCSHDSQIFPQRDYLLFAFDALKTKYLPIEIKEDRIRIFTDKISSLDKITEYREMVILVKRFFKFYFDVDITGVRSEIIEDSLSHDGI